MLDKFDGSELTPAAACAKYECSPLDLTRHVLQEFLRIHRDEIDAMEIIDPVARRAALVASPKPTTEKMRLNPRDAGGSSVEIVG